MESAGAAGGALVAAVAQLQRRTAIAVFHAARAPDLANCLELALTR